MPMRVTFELSDRDLEYFRETLTAIELRSAEISSEELVARAASLLKELPTDAPEFVLERASKLRSMVEMVKDDEWRLQGDDREGVVRALSYLADPKDLIPDAIPGIGFLDDAIMIELVVRELQHELDAYTDFCRLRDKKDQILKSGRAGATSREEWLEAKRDRLQARMRRRRRRRAATRVPRAGVSHKSPFSLW